MKEFGLFLSYIEAADAAAQVLSFFVSPKISVANFHASWKILIGILQRSEPLQRISSHIEAKLSWLAIQTKIQTISWQHWLKLRIKRKRGMMWLQHDVGTGGAAAVLKRDCMPWVKIDIVTKQCCKVEHILGKVGLIRWQSSLLFHCSSLAINHNLNLSFMHFL